MSKRNGTRCLARERKTKFVEIFRTTPTNTVCPNFYVLSHANGCAFQPQCSYCYLKSSFWHLDAPHVFTNVGTMLDEVRAWIGQDELESYVLNMGNLSDSLGFEEARPLMGRLIALFRDEAEAKARKHALLLVTKGGIEECQPILDQEPCPNVIISFSFNSRQAARRHERGAAPPAERFEAARRLNAQGWRVRGRIDPMLLGFDYAWVIEQVRRLAPERLTLGTLRAEPSLPRFVGDGLFTALEKPQGEKCLARYPREERLALYRQAVEALAGLCPIGLCEETPDVWDALGLDKEAKCCNCGS